MRDKSIVEGALRRLEDAEERGVRIRGDLESRGVAPEFSTPVARRLSAIASDLSDEEYDAVLEGVATAYGVHCQSSDDAADEVRDICELERLMEGFTGELKKLEEGLQILSAYVVRMSARTTPNPPNTLH